jgi:hypothetical protein
MKNAVEQIHWEMLASVLIPHLQRILPMRAAIQQNWILTVGRFWRRKRSLGRKRNRKRAMRQWEIRKMRPFQMMAWSTL